MQHWIYKQDHFSILHVILGERVSAVQHICDMVAECELPLFFFRGCTWMYGYEEIFE